MAEAYSEIIKLMRNAPNNMRNHLLLEGNYWAGLHAQVKTRLDRGSAHEVLMHVKGPAPEVRDVFYRVVDYFNRHGVRRSVALGARGRRAARFVRAVFGRHLRVVSPAHSRRHNTQRGVHPTRKSSTGWPAVDYRRVSFFTGFLG